MDIDESPEKLAATYTHKYLGEALQYFFSRAVMNLYDGNNPVNILDYCPMLKQGHALSTTSVAVFALYSRINGLMRGRYVVPDAIMVEAFGGTIPAYYYMDAARKIPMEQALSDGLIDTPLNTFQAIQIRSPQFNPNSFGFYFYQNMITLNSFNYVDAENGGDELLHNQELVLQLGYENALMKKIGDALAVFRRLHGQGKGNTVPIDRYDIYDIYSIAYQRGGPNAFTETLENDPNIDKLRLAIIRKDIPLILAYLRIYDPRDDNHKAYFLAVDTNDADIINIVKENIIQRTLLEGAAFGNRIEENMGIETTIPQELYTLARGRF